LKEQDLACSQKNKREGRLLVFIEESGLRERPTQVLA